MGETVYDGYQLRPGKKMAQTRYWEVGRDRKMPQTGLADATLPRRAMAAELLDAETEQRLARAWRDDRNEAALHRLIVAYIRLAISMAGKYRRYGAPMGDLIQQANLGLMKAADKFDPDRGVRFSTYAVWWIKASIQDYVMRNWSMVRTGSTAAQKSLFFNLKRVQSLIERTARDNDQVLDSHQIRQRVASQVGVALVDVEMMQGRMAGGDLSLNATQGSDGESREWIDLLEDDHVLAEEIVADRQDRLTARGWIAEAMQQLSGRERFIVAQRKLRERPRTLEYLGGQLGISKERVRQIEAAAFGKMRDHLQSQHPHIRDLIC